MDSAPATDPTTTRRHPCPSWCRLGHGHLFEVLTGSDDLSRHHERVLTQLDVSEDGTTWTQLQLVLSQEEQVYAAGAGGRHLLEPFLSITGEDVRIDADGARDLARALLAGADRLEALADAVGTIDQDGAR